MVEYKKMVIPGIKFPFLSDFQLITTTTIRKNVLKKYFVCLWELEVSLIN